MNTAEPRSTPRPKGRWFVVLTGIITALLAAALVVAGTELLWSWAVFDRTPSSFQLLVIAILVVPALFLLAMLMTAVLALRFAALGRLRLPAWLLVACTIGFWATMVIGALIEARLGLSLQVAGVVAFYGIGICGALYWLGRRAYRVAIPEAAWAWKLVGCGYCAAGTALAIHAGMALLALVGLIHAPFWTFIMLVTGGGFLALASAGMAIALFKSGGAVGATDPHPA